MKKVKTNNVQITYPESIDEISTAKAIEIYPVLKRLFKQRIDEGWFDNIEFLSYFCDFEGITDHDEKYEIASQLSEKAPNGEALFFQLNLSKIGNISENKNLIPKEIIIDGDKYVIPKDLFEIELKQGQLSAFNRITKSIENKYKTGKFTSVLQSLSIGTDIEALTREETNIYDEYLNLVFDGYVENINVLAAIILQALQGNFKPKEADKLALKILELPAVKILPIGFFLLMRQRESLSTKIIFSLVATLQIYVMRSNLKGQNIVNSQTQHSLVTY